MRFMPRACYCAELLKRSSSGTALDMIWTFRRASILESGGIPLLSDRLRRNYCSECDLFEFAAGGCDWAARQASWPRNADQGTAGAKSRQHSTECADRKMQLMNWRPTYLRNAASPWISCFLTSFRTPISFTMGERKSGFLRAPGNCRTW